MKMMMKMMIVMIAIMSSRDRMGSTLRRKRRYGTTATSSTDKSSS
jgi:hypothetical protein